MQPLRVWSTVALFLLGSCSGARIGGSFEGPSEPSRGVNLRQLTRYYLEQSDSLIVPARQEILRGRRRLWFRVDNTNPMKVVAPVRYSSDEIQDLFRLDVDRLVRSQGGPDVLGATYRWYASRPFDHHSQNPVPPYRTLQVWGSLFYPPIKRLTHPLGFYHAGFSDDFDPDTVSSPYFDPAFQMELDDMTGTELTYGNDLRALFNGVESYPEKLRLVAEAKRFLYIAVMTIVADETGRKLIRLMVDRKRAGVDVRLITEGFYTFSVSNFAIGVLEKEGIPVVRVEDKRLNQVDRMFHDKFWIRDGDEAILGGMNVIDYENMATGFDFLNRDTDVRVRGPAVTDLLGRFIALWHRYDREGRSIDSAETYCARQRIAERAAGKRGREQYALWLGDPRTRMNGICRTAVQGDDAAPQKIATLLTRYLEAAKHSFYLTSPGVDYDPERTPPSSVDTLARTMIAKAIVPGFSANVITNGSDGGMGEATSFLRLRVKDATLAGNPLWIDMLTPMINSSGRGINRGTRQAVKPFLSAGIHVYEYCNYIHAKEFYFDRLLVGIASWNFDVNSADKNHEAAIFCLDRGLRRQLERRLVLDMVNAVPVIPQMTGHWSPAVE